MVPVSGLPCGLSGLPYRRCVDAGRMAIRPGLGPRTSLNANGQCSDRDYLERMPTECNRLDSAAFPSTRDKGHPILAVGLHRSHLSRE